jgi:hypothetical protein
VEVASPRDTCLDTTRRLSLPTPLPSTKGAVVRGSISPRTDSLYQQLNFNCSLPPLEPHSTCMTRTRSNILGNR